MYECPKQFAFPPNIPQSHTPQSDNITQNSSVLVLKLSLFVRREKYINCLCLSQEMNLRGPRKTRVKERASAKKKKTGLTRSDRCCWFASTSIEFVYNGSSWQLFQPITRQEIIVHINDTIEWLYKEKARDFFFKDLLEKMRMYFLLHCLAQGCRHHTPMFNSRYKESGRRLVKENSPCRLHICQARLKPLFECLGRCSLWYAHATVCFISSWARKRPGNLYSDCI